MSIVVPRTYRPNVAIGGGQREVVARALRDYSLLTSEQVYFLDGEADGTLLADRLAEPGPPLVSAADVLEVLELISALQRMGPREELDHPWGYVRRGPGGEDGEFRLAAPGESGARGNWHDSDPIKLAHEMYEDHLLRRGLLPV